MHHNEEKREHQRFTIDANVRIEIGEMTNNHSTDISLGGMFVKTHAPFPIGTVFSFQLETLGAPLIKGKAEVAWIRGNEQPTQDSPPGMGARFLDLDEISQAIIFRIVDRRIQEDGSEPFDLDSGK